jgi:hypothetical protein
MFVRLAFAAAVVWEPEILIVDEALAVGDIFFQQKCFTRIKSLQEGGATILFVSHNTQSVLNLCHRAAVLNHGEMIYFGDASEAVERYYESYYMDHRSEKPLALSLKTAVRDAESSPVMVASDINLPLITDFTGKNRYGIQTGLIQGVCITDTNGNSKSAVSTEESMVLSIKLGHYPEHLWPLNVGFHLRDRLGQMIIATNTKMLGQDLDGYAPGQGLMCQFRFKPQIAPGEYTLDVAVAENKFDAKKIYDWINNVMSITVSSGVKDREQAGIARPDISVTVN